MLVLERFSTPLATRSGKTYPGLSISNPFMIRTEFDFQTAWIAACRRDDMEGEKEVEENPDDLRSEPGDTPGDLPDFDPSEDEGDHLDPSSPLTTPPSSPLVPPTNLPDVRAANVILSTPHPDSVHSYSANPSPRALSLAHLPSPSPSAALYPVEPFALASNLPKTTADYSAPQQAESAIEERKRKRTENARAANSARRANKRHKETTKRREQERMPVHGQGYVNRYLKVDRVGHDFDVLEYRAVRGGDTGKVERKAGKKVPVTLETAGETGHSTFLWDGIRTTHIIDRTNNISIVCVGTPVESDYRPPEKKWDASMRRLGDFLESTRQKYHSKLSKKDRTNRRGPYPGVSVGFTRGSGSKSVHNLKHSAAHQPMVDELVGNHDAERLVAFQNEALAAHFPKVYCDLKEKVEAIRERHPNVKPTFPSHSIYPGCTFNLGPETVTEEHTDPGNIPAVPCAVTALGPYDPDLGGDLVLEDLKLIIRFPPGSTILLSSASIRHSNVPIQKGERRYSVTQFCPGGLYRWVRHGFKPACTLSRAAREAADGNAEARWRAYWALLSTPESLEEDRGRLVKKEAEWLANWNAARKVEVERGVGCHTDLN